MIGVEIRWQSNSGRLPAGCRAASIVWHDRVASSIRKTGNDVKVGSIIIRPVLPVSRPAGTRPFFLFDWQVRGRTKKKKGQRFSSPCRQPLGRILYVANGWFDLAGQSPSSFPSFFFNGLRGSTDRVCFGPAQIGSLSTAPSTSVPGQHKSNSSSTNSTTFYPLGYSILSISLFTSTHFN